MPTMKHATIILLLLLTINLPASVVAGISDNPPTYQPLSRYTRIAVDIHGPVVFGEALWHIAQDYYSNSGIAINTAMTGLFRFNPQVFYGGNINCLKTGRLLWLPDANTFSTISDQEATQLVREHQQQWHTMQRRCNP